MPRAGKSDGATGGLAELTRLSNGKDMSACSNAEIKERLRELVKFLTTDAQSLDGEHIYNAMMKNGFAKEILREAYTGKDAPQATQILAASVITEVGLQTAPAFLFEGHEKKVLEFLLRQFYHLAKATRESETYHIVYSILEGVVKSGVFTLLADSTLEGGDALLCEVFDVVINRLAPVAEEHGDVAFSSQLEELLKGIFDEMQTVHEDILALFLKPLGSKTKAKDSNPAGRALVKAVVRRLGQDMANVVIDYVKRKLDSLDTALTSVDKLEQKDVLEQIRFMFYVIMALGDGHRTMNSQLLPHIASRLGHEVTALRRLAVLAMAKVFDTHTTAWTEYGLLFSATLKKYQDVSKDIRVAMIDWTARFLPKHTDAAEKVGEHFVGCVLDQDVDVRKEALKRVLAMAREDLAVLPRFVVEKAIDRIRDKKHMVRSYAMEQFAELYAHIFENHDKIPAPYNQIPSRILEVYAGGDVDVRRDAERLIANVILPEDDAEDAAVKAGESDSPLTFALVKLWTNLPEGCRMTLSRLLTTKKPIRELMGAFLHQRPKIRSKDATEKAEAHAKMHKILTTLHSVCVLPHGLELLLYVKDEKVFEVLGRICTEPGAGMDLKNEVVGLLKKASKDAAELKPLPKTVDLLLTRMMFPVSNALIAGCLDIYTSMWNVRDGKRCVYVSELVSVLFTAFPEVCRAVPQAPSELVAAVQRVAEEEIEHEGHGGEDDVVLNPPPASPRAAKRLKEMTLSQRRATLCNLLRALKQYIHYSGEHGVAGLAKAEVTVLQKTLKKLAVHSPIGIAKLCVQVLHGVLAPAQRGAAFAALTAESLKGMDIQDVENYKTAALLKVLQHCLTLQPPTDMTALGAVAKFSTQILQQLYKQDIPTSKHHSFKKPPLACVVYRAALKVFTAYIAALPNKLQSVDGVKMNFKVLMRYCEYTASKEYDLAKSIQTTDTTKAMLRLGRNNDLRRILFSAVGVLKVWQTLAYMTMYEHNADARAEIGRVLHRDLTKNRLPMSFAQLLCLTLVDRSKTNFSKAKERVHEMIDHYRTRCKQYSVKLDSMQAPGYCPEYILPSLVHLLSRWHFLESLRPSYQPIQRLLFIVFDKLTERKQCTGFLFDLLTRLKGCDDAQQPESTNTRLIVDICFMVLKSVTNTKEVKFEPFPGMIHISTLFVPHAQSNAKLRDPVYLDMDAFVPITKRNDRNNNPMGLAEEEDMGSPTRATSPRKGKDGASPSNANATPQQSPKSGKRKLNFDADEKAPASTKRAKTTTPATAASSKAKGSSRTRSPPAKKAKKK